MRALVVVLVLLAGILVAADFAAREVAERRVAARLEGDLDLDARPQVEIEAFPFLLHLAGGTIPSVAVAAEDVSRRGITLEEVALRLDDVRFDLAALSAAGGQVRVGGGRGRAEMTEAQFSELLRRRGVPVEVRFVDGKVRVSADGREARGDVALDGRSLVLSSPALPATYAVTLPRVGAGISYRSLEVGSGVIRLDLAIRAGTVDV